MPTENSIKNNPRWLIGDWHYWPDSGLIKQQQQQHQLPTQLNQVLHLLVLNAPAVVARESFLDSVWSGKVVNEDALSRTIAELRKYLGDSARQAKYIKTIPKKGYQLAIEPLVFQQKIKHITQKVIFAIFLISLLLLTWLWPKQHSVDALLTQAVANAQRITSKPGMEQQSQLTSDGQWLTYVTNTAEESYITIQSLEDLNQSVQIELAHHRLSSPVYDAEINQLWFLAKDKSQCKLMSKNLNNQTIKSWSDCVFEVESRTLTADFKQNRLYFSKTQTNKQVSIHQLNAKTGEVSKLTEPDNVSFQDWSPSLSPNKRWLGFSRGNQSVRNLWLRDLPTGQELPITTGEHYSVSHDWLDSRHIVFDSDRSGSRQLFVIDVEDLSIHAIGGYGAQHPSFDQSGQTMSFQKVSYEANIWQHDLRTNQFSRLVHSTKYDNNPAFAPDGKSFAFSSNRQDIGSIWVYDYESQKDYLLLALPATKLTRPAWTTDGENLLVTANDKQGYWTLLYDVETKSHQKLPFSMNNHSAVEHGGSFYALTKSGASNHQIVKIMNGTETILPMKHVSRFMFLSDGRMVYSKSNAAGLYVIDSQQLQEQVLIKNFPSTAINLWTAVNQSIYYDAAGHDAGLYRFDVNTSTNEKISDYRPFSVGTSLSVDVQENRILMARTDRAESDVFKTTIQ